MPATSTTLSELCIPTFTYVSCLCESDHAPAIEQVRFKFEQLFREVDRAGREAGYDPLDLRYVIFALVAFADEKLLSRQWAHREIWLSEPLQLVFFNMNSAGQEFYARLAQVRDGSAQSAAGAQITECYYLCLALGFRGCYFGSAAADKRRQDLQEEIYHELAPNKRRPDITLSIAEGGHSANGATKLRPVWLVPLVCLLLGVGVFAGLWWHLAHITDEARSGLPTRGAH
ncbi:MAG: DotU family type IV/VI secretion system protein [Myxococcota bacterium]